MSAYQTLVALSQFCYSKISKTFQVVSDSIGHSSRPAFPSVLRFLPFALRTEVAKRQWRTAQGSTSSRDLKRHVLVLRPQLPHDLFCVQPATIPILTDSLPSF